MPETKNRELLQQYLADPELISDEKVDLIYTLITAVCPSKVDILKISGYDTTQSFDTAIPSPYAQKLREVYPDFNNGSYIYDYSQNHVWGEMRNVYNLFAKKVIQTLCLT